MRFTHVATRAALHWRVVENFIEVLQTVEVLLTILGAITVLRAVACQGPRTTLVRPVPEKQGLVLDII